MIPGKVYVQICWNWSQLLTLVLNGANVNITSFSESYRKLDEKNLKELKKKQRKGKINEMLIYQMTS